MAKMIAGLGLGIQGSIDDLSIYKMRGVDKPIVRRKGGPSKEKIMTDPEMRQVRNSISEFGGRAKAGKYIMQALTFQKPLADHNIAGPLNALMVPVQNMDPVEEWGKRDVRLSAYPHILNGFSLNRQNTFDSTVRFPVEHALSRETLTAAVQLPELMPDISFFAPEKYPWFSIIVTLGIVPDIIFTGSLHKYEPTHHGYFNLQPGQAVTDWHPVAQGAPATPLEVKHSSLPPDEHFTLVLAIGVRYGTQYNTHTIQQAKYAGCAKVLAVV
ncbi:hypothetical protein HB364_05505 [Pseudoflavitalea sp. X16]|uniref:hypothetical protein n=1 Tax=Paraflavitalea devenefica TaxID=2716334 RepID=UPI0014240E96|nr:hypothetical protein [Paraflavitalea devenefica]NII24523.1 hypothetical protein [Paraflavitalea devenefica]